MNIWDYISPYIWAVVATWVAAHAVKYIIALTKGTQLSFKKQVFVSGGMPSSHVATAVALTVVILLIDGYSSGLFGLAVLFTLVVAHDAVRVRRSSGEQGVALTALIKESKSSIKPPRVAMGHTVPEVVAGVVFGAISGTIVYLLT